MVVNFPTSFLLSAFVDAEAPDENFDFGHRTGLLLMYDRTSDSVFCILIKCRACERASWCSNGMVMASPTRAKALNFLSALF